MKGKTLVLMTNYYAALDSPAFREYFSKYCSVNITYCIVDISSFVHPIDRQDVEYSLLRIGFRKVYVINSSRLLSIVRLVAEHRRSFSKVFADAVFSPFQYFIFKVMAAKSVYCTIVPIVVPAILVDGVSDASIFAYTSCFSRH